ncbi:MAG: single-stranded-DNA-specific exonuclease RecJ [Chitinophagales bacterium]|nr:single-stranded-DNA-specific exonuclease RecJ [Chitinophagales bacterium]
MKKWIYPDFPRDTSISLQQRLKIHPVLCDLLVQRGIESYDEAYKFFRPTLTDLHDPFLMKGMSLAVERIVEAKEKNEKILLFGDYDVDGTTAVAVVYKFLKPYFPDLLYYIPNRYTEGYGLSKEGIDFAKEMDCALVIALDCGIKAIEKCKYAKEAEIDVIICDHHLPAEILPDAFVILNPKQTDCNYPFKELSGCGIGFKLMQALSEKVLWNSVELSSLLDLLVVSIASDIVPIVGENRILAYHGLKVLNETPSVGMSMIMKEAGIKSIRSISDIVFVIGPRINAVGRMDDANLAVKLLVAENDSECKLEAQWMNTKNEERKILDRSITKEALQQVKENKNFYKEKATIVFNDEWHKGVVGIVASRLIEHHYKPTIVLTLSKGLITGSARSIKGFNITNALVQCDEWLTAYGGHEFAAGLSLKPENLQNFKQAFLTICNNEIHDDMLIPRLKIDAELDFRTIDHRFYNILNQFAPFGPSNRRPVFVSCNVNAASGSRVVKEDHLKLTLKQNNEWKKGIAFNMASYYSDVIRKRFDICYSLEENNWNGQSNIELNLKDIKI